MSIAPIGIALVVLVTDAGGQGSAEREGSPRPASELLVSFDQLEEGLGRDGVRVLDTRPEADYAKGHVPGAVRVDLKPIADQASKPGGLADAGAWAELVAPLGIGPEDRVIVYDGKRQLDAARLWWLLGYLGVDRVALLDGNFPLWEREGRPVSTDAVAVEPSTFEVRLREDRVASREEVLDALKGRGFSIIDARSEAEHTGEEARSKRGGRLPGAAHVEWSELVDDDGRFLSLQAIREKLAAAGVDPTKPAITHCQGGGRASVDAFVLERLGVPTQNYYLGWSEWGEDEACPIEAGAKAGAPK